MASGKDHNGDPIARNSPAQGLAGQALPYTGTGPLRPYASVEEIASADLPRLAAAPTACHAMLLLHSRHCRNSRHGLTKSDFSAATALFRKPRQAFVIDEEEAAGHDSAVLLCFNREQCRSHALRFDEYTYFNYADNEALHISETEYAALREVIGCIGKEQRHDTDSHSEAVMSHLAAAAFDLCLRFYGRQFILRSDSSRKTVEALHKLIDGHYEAARPLSRPTEPPQTAWLAKSLGLSEQYLDDLCRHESGLGVADHVKLRRVEMAREYLANTSLPPSVIARKLGFCSTCCLNSILEKTFGACATACGKAS